MRLLFIIIVSFFLLAGCAENRPDLPNAKIHFQKLYPGVQIISIIISEDEVVARSFKFRYRKQEAQSDKEIEIQFMQNEKTKQWEPVPKPPKELP